MKLSSAETINVFSQVKKIVTYLGHVFLLTLDGKLYEYGTKFPLILEESHEPSHFDGIYTIDLGNNTITDIISNDFGSFFAITEFETVFSFGVSKFGNLGNGYVGDFLSTWTSVCFANDGGNLGNIQEVKPFIDTTLFLTNDGFLYACGNNRTHLTTANPRKGALCVGKDTDLVEYPTLVIHTNIDSPHGKVKQYEWNGNLIVLTNEGKLLLDYGTNTNRRLQEYRILDNLNYNFMYESGVGRPPSTETLDNPTDTPPPLDYVGDFQALHANTAD
jgi:hypothetical protein